MGYALIGVRIHPFIQVHTLLLVTVQRAYVLARLSLDNTLRPGGCDLVAQSLGLVGGLPMHLSMR
jgi:hypothetical protein